MVTVVKEPFPLWLFNGFINIFISVPGLSHLGDDSDGDESTSPLQLS